MKETHKSFLLGVAVGFLIAFLAVLAVLYLYIEYAPHPAARIAARVRVPSVPGTVDAAYDLDLIGLDGRDFDLEEVRGKVVYLSFWKSTRSACVAEMPTVQKLFERTVDDRIAFVCVAREEPDAARRFIRRTGYTLPVYSLRGPLPELYDRSPLPATFILAADGKIAFEIVGPAKWDDDRVVRFLERLKEG